MMVRCTIWSLCLLAALAGGAIGYGQKQPALIPLPVQCTLLPGTFKVTKATRLYCGDSSLLPAVALLNEYLSSYTGFRLKIVAAKPGNNSIHMRVDTTAVTNSEGYLLSITKDKISITVRSTPGLIYAMQTCRQLWQPRGAMLSLPACNIIDYPRFGYRGMALDVSRHLFPLTFIKKYIDLLSLYKFNTFHWHLTDDQGWRIEIKKFPRLQTVAAWRSETLIGHKKEVPHVFDGERYGGYYSQDEAREVVRYAAQRGITVIPEIEMPGHALAALAAYPYLGCTGGPYATATFWGVFDDVYCAGNDSTFDFLEGVLDEVMQVFPSDKIHIGGDECPKTRWRQCPKCQLRIQQLGLKDEQALQSYFVQRIEKYVDSKGRTIIGWDEILEGGLAPNATVMSWQGEAGGIAAARQRHQVVLTPESNLYFDYYQSLYPQEPLAAGGYTPLSKVYTYEPAATADPKVQSYITGVEGQAWSEYFTTVAKALYMIFPRALALAETAWAPASSRNYQGFLARLRSQDRLLKRLNVGYAANFDEVTWQSTATGDGTVSVTLQSSYPGAAIQYVINPPGQNRAFTPYKASFTMTQSAVLKARLLNDSRHQRTLTQAFVIHKAVGKQVVLKTAPVARFSTDAQTLVNGVFGNSRYNDNQWMGFSEGRFEAVVDLGTLTTLTRVGTRVLNYRWQKMWAPQQLEFLVSADGEAYSKVYVQSRFDKAGINEVFAAIVPVQARYVKVIAAGITTIPQGEYGAGGKPLLMLDEILIN